MNRRGLLHRTACGAILVVALAVGACDSVETTGGKLITFKAYAAGPVDANGGEPCGPNGTGAPLTTTSSDGWQVTILSARLQIGGVYLIEGVYNGGSDNTMCVVSDGVYCGQVPGGITETATGDPGLNLLCPDPTEFSVFGNGTADLAGTAQIWLMGGQHTCTAGADGGAQLCGPAIVDEIDTQTDSTPIVEVAGFACPPGVAPCAAKSKGAVNFQATVTISEDNRGIPAMPALPGDYPICLRRILQLAPINIQLFQGGTLYVRADPRGWFGQVEFGANAPCTTQLTGTGSGDAGTGDGGVPEAGGQDAGRGDGGNSDSGSAADAATGCSSVCQGLQEVTPAMGDTPALYEIPDTDQSQIGNLFFSGIRGGTTPSGASVYSVEFTTSD